MNKSGRPKKDELQLRSEYLEVRLGRDEKRAFQEAATISGLALSSWVRERLRRIAAQELSDANMPIAFRNGGLNA